MSCELLLFLNDRGSVSRLAKKYTTKPTNSKKLIPIEDKNIRKVTALT